ncbi:high frequency lysogenization protein HflD [Hahella sp. SMD15-11]|uniref:High frequency lysogenization protein HflD homolog n=1 Tax=Thermohahella caldifontis TaxID=3142973 RepID=A0AB39UX44_9GAMM
MNLTPQEEQVIALAGVFQAGALVDQLARQGMAGQTAINATLGSLFVRHPDSALDVFGDLFALQTGLQELRALLARENDPSRINALRYAITLLYLEGKLNKKPVLLARIGEFLDQLGEVSGADLQDEAVLATLANAYSATVGTLSQRIRVVGDPQYLKPEASANRIRALLLGGIRAARLWRQLGGRRWHLLVRRRRLLETCEALLHR